ncbi:hypothetical protein J6590_073607 [Homalodisca vitripennis]|nr:hypothetical protein J6590_073607 [Homalodisca vitripennis]
MFQHTQTLRECRHRGVTPLNAVTSSTNEAAFMLNAKVNRHNRHYWSDVNLHWMRDQYVQY